MKRIVVHPADPEPDRIAIAAACIRAGGVVAYPTDTLYGLAADPGNERAVERVFSVKGRPSDRPVPLVAASLEAAERAGRLTADARRLARQFWPGPLTLIVPAERGIASAVHHGTGTVGLRVPDHAVARALAAAAGGLITATSANRSGEPASNLPRDAAALEESGLDVLIDAGPSPGGEPSTVVDVCGETARLVRTGAVPWERVLESLR